MKIMVIDTVGGDRFSDHYREYFPNADLRGLELRNDGDCHPHGYQCGYYAGVFTALMKERCEIVFVRVFDAYGTPVPGSNSWMLDVIKSEKPDIITCSWGQADSDHKWGDRVGAITWNQWADLYKSITGKIGAVSFFAAGNDDKNDMDEDVDFPQRLMADHVCIIGSHNKSGKPSKFSGDGKGVLVTFWGENIKLLSDVKWDSGSGTSFSCPKAAGLCALLGYNATQFRKYVKENATRPINYIGPVPHPKWGEGSLEYKYQDGLMMLPADLRPPRSSRNFRMSKYRDYDIVCK